MHVVLHVEYPAQEPKTFHISLSLSSGDPLRDELIRQMRAEGHVPPGMAAERLTVLDKHGAVISDADVLVPGETVTVKVRLTESADTPGESAVATAPAIKAAAATVAEDTLRAAAVSTAVSESSASSRPVLAAPRSLLERTAPAAGHCVIYVARRDMKNVIASRVPTSLLRAPRDAAALHKPLHSTQVGHQLTKRHTDRTRLVLSDAAGVQIVSPARQLVPRLLVIGHMLTVNAAKVTQCVKELKKAAALPADVVMEAPKLPPGYHSEGSRSHSPPIPSTPVASGRSPHWRMGPDPRARASPAAFSTPSRAAVPPTRSMPYPPGAHAAAAGMGRPAYSRDPSKRAMMHSTPTGVADASPGSSPYAAASFAGHAPMRPGMRGRGAAARTPHYAAPAHPSPAALPAYGASGSRFSSGLSASSGTFVPGAMHTPVMPGSQGAPSARYSGGGFQPGHGPLPTRRDPAHFRHLHARRR